MNEPEQLAELLENARPMRRDQVRLDRDDVRQLAKSIAASGAPASISEAVGAIADRVREARRIPLTDYVRLPAGEVRELAANLRSAIQSGDSF